MRGESVRSLIITKWAHIIVDFGDHWADARLAAEPTIQTSEALI